MPSVYIETTIPSYYFETRKTLQALHWREHTRRWWDGHRHRYELVTSQSVLLELRDAPEEKAKKGLELLRGVVLLEADRDVLNLAAYYIAERLMPRQSTADAVHVAASSIFRIDYLLTWNCRHLANANKVRHLQVLNSRLGLPVPTITTPISLDPEESV